MISIATQIGNRSHHRATDNNISVLITCNRKRLKKKKTDRQTHNNRIYTFFVLYVRGKRQQITSFSTLCTLKDEKIGCKQKPQNKVKPIRKCQLIGNIFIYFSLSFSQVFSFTLRVHTPKRTTTHFLNLNLFSFYHFF